MKSCLRPQCQCTELFYQSSLGGCSPYHTKCNKDKNRLKLNFRNKTRNISNTNINYIHTRDFVSIQIPHDEILAENIVEFELNVFTECTKDELHEMLSDTRKLKAVWIHQ